MSPDSPVGPIDKYIELFGMLKSKLVGINFLQTVRGDLVVLSEIQGLLLKLNKPDVPGPIVDIILDFKPLLE